MAPSTATPLNQPFRPDSALNRQRASGHFNRHGHKLTGNWSVDSNNIAHLNRTCC